MSCLLLVLQSTTVGASSIILTKDRLKIRTMIKYVFKRLSVTNIKKKYIKRFNVGDSSPLHTTVKRWVAEFKVGQTSTTDDPRVVLPINLIGKKKNRKSTKSFW